MDPQTPKPNDTSAAASAFQSALKKSKQHTNNAHKKHLVVKAIIGVVILLASAAATIFVAQLISVPKVNPLDSQDPSTGLRAGVDEKKGFEKGSTASFGYFEVKIDKSVINYVPESNALPRNKGYVFLLLNITAKNTDVDAHLLSDINLAVLDGETVINSSPYVRLSPAIQGNVIEPGATFNGNLVYEVPANASDLKLYYNTSIYNDDQGKLKKIEYTLPF